MGLDRYWPTSSAEESDWIREKNARVFWVISFLLSFSCYYFLSTCHCWCLSVFFTFFSKACCFLKYNKQELPSFCSLWKSNQKVNKKSIQMFFLLEMKFLGFGERTFKTRHIYSDFLSNLLFFLPALHLFLAKQWWKQTQMLSTLISVKKLLMHLLSGNWGQHGCKVWVLDSNWREVMLIFWNYLVAAFVSLRFTTTINECTFLVTWWTSIFDRYPLDLV